MIIYISELKTYFDHNMCSWHFFFMFMFMFQFVFKFHIIFRFHAYSIWHLRYLYGMMPIRTSFKYTCPSMNLFFLEIGIIPIESFERKLWHFHAKLVGLPILPEGQFAILIFQCLDSNGSPPTGITQIGAPDLMLRPKLLVLLYD